MTGQMHVDEIRTDRQLVQRLIFSQFPPWADLPITPVRSAGTDNALYRLGPEMVVRLPRIHWAVPQVEKEHRWLPVLAPFLPLEIPRPLAMGAPEHGYPWHWSVYAWLAGDNATAAQIADPRQVATELAGFIRALQAIDAADGPRPGDHNSARGEPLAARDAPTRAGIAALGHLFPAAAMRAVWDEALAAPPWSGPPVWIHGDLQAGNLLCRQGRLSAVIDFGCLGVGDPACDVMAAWLFLGADTRQHFRTLLQVDDATWTRARGWALSMGAIALPYYQTTNPTLAGIAHRAIGEALADSGAVG